MQFLEFIIGFAIIFGFWNGVRGRGFFSKGAKEKRMPHRILAPFFGRIACCIYLGLSSYGFLEWQGVSLPDSGYFSGNGAVGFFLAILFGWGKYFMAFHGLNKLHERENPWVDYVVNRIMDYVPGKAYSAAYCRKYGVWGMTLVGVQFIPLFIYPLIEAAPPVWVYFTPIAALSMGLVYGALRYKKEHDETTIPEIVFAAIIGGVYGFVMAFCVT